MKEVAVISGKGGTGKTSVVAALAAISGRVVLADCDVDAADLHLVLEPEIRRKGMFIGGKIASIDPGLCSGCGVCIQLCRYGAISSVVDASADAAAQNEENHAAKSRNQDAKLVYTINGSACEGCGVCAYYCPTAAIALEDEANGEWYISDTRFGPMVHARLFPGSENSGKLVSLIRRMAESVALKEDLSLIMIDGSPGIGCPVIASLTGVDFALIVTEPTMPGEHDLGRILELTKHFGIESAVVVNRYDINEDMTMHIEQFAGSRGVELEGRIRYDRVFTEAQIKGRSVMELPAGPAAEDIVNVWNMIRGRIEEDEKQDES